MSTALSDPEKTDDPSPWGEVAVVYRRICTLRASGHSLEAARVQSTELSRLLARLRATVNGPAESDGRLRTLFAAEEERVLNARVLAELLVPLLSEHLGEAAAGIARPARDRSSTRPDIPAGTAAIALPPPTTAPGIADFIDEMLAQDRATAADRSRRRAS